mgnify:CR=1 FL=1
MKKLIGKIISKDIKKFYKTYPITMVSIFLFTIYAVINNFNDYYVIPITLIFFGVWEFLLETFFESKKIVLAHISENNNTPELAYSTTKDILKEADLDREVIIAKQYESLEEIEV